MKAAPARPARTGPRSLRQWQKWLIGLIATRYDGLDHFAVVQPGVLMRCGQPRIRDLEQIRRAHGLRTIVCARGGTRHPLRGAWFRREQAYCARADIRLEHMPFSDSGPPPADVFEQFLALVGDPARWPVLVHCEQGFHRTGVLCAAYRIATCGWTLSAALDEMRTYGFDPAEAKRQALVDALRLWANGRA